jgi:glucosamine--fructose-6-phosphate aminotransferase (isomerizing)
LVNIKKMGYKALVITNVPGSTLSREADYTLYTHAGPEIAVASTKAYTAQIAVLVILAYDCSRIKGMALQFDPFHELSLAANAMEIMINNKEKMEEIVWKYLSLAEISCIQAEGFAGGELKHGTIALIEEETPVIALITQHHIKGMEEKDDQVMMPAIHEYLTPLLSVIPLQLMAYYAALYRGCDVDKPRNLAKSVTVE